MILIDTSVLGRLAQFKSPLHTVALKAVHRLIRERRRMFIAPQSIYEFWVVATRPVNVNGFGWPAQRAAEWINYFEGSFELLADVPNIYSLWRQLVENYNSCGKPAHDARLVAIMNVYALREILTFNGGDFVRYGVTVLQPKNLQ